MIRAVVREPSFAILLGAAWLFCFLLTAGSWNLTAANPVDGDDALRLLQVRDFMAGQGWFDLHQPRLGPFGYDSHWSRLIDAGLAGFISLFQIFVDRNAAEALTAIVWPVLWLAPTMGAVAAIAWRIGGREAAVIALLLCLFGLPGFQQFKPGRIDHHNVQIALAVLVVAATVWSDRMLWAARAAGALTGLALAIGLEGLPFLALAGAAFALRYAADPRAAPALRAYGLSVAGSAVAAFFVSVGPDHWTQSVCDQIAINYVAAIAVGGLGLALAAKLRPSAPGWARVAAVMAAGGAALALFAVLEPRCLAGPYGQIDPAVMPVLLAEVAEMQSLPRMLGRDMAAGVAAAAFPAAGLVAALMVAARFRRYVDFGVLTAIAASLIACAIMFVAFKGYPYAMWLGVPFVSAAVVDLFHRFRLTGLVPRFAAALVVTPITISVTAMAIAAATTSGSIAPGTPDRQACVQKESYEQLAHLPKGLLVANELEWGSYLLLWTPHSVLGAPYHRLAEGMALTHAFFARPPERARAALTRAHVDYVVTCGSRGSAGLSTDERPGSLWARLSAGEIPGWLERVAATNGQAVAVYRVKH